ncbi:Na-translocating system protein MpsC family protein [Cytobacillus sp. S13-E01]|uniref:Na-translocating system protein MpsC family protein n=1 Tax=Cytobacillus sp. S13-E01 TaxID=3031326 RepID=UPI0023D87D96|nr:Na-translocating system protein MpsC family protein [Cytobacillus sp. S13-E01]MDF0728762.1 Na-translocating system protein MpsC family protein [Cytobacillus sp. S13-E01]
MLKTKGSQEDLIYLSSTLSKLLKRKFGKGPETCYASLKDNMISIHIRHFITPAEEVLIENGEVNLAYHFRSSIMNAIFREFKREISHSIEIECKDIFHDWNYGINTGVILLILEDSIGEMTTVTENETLLEVAKIVSLKIHKIPSSYKIINFNQNSYVISYKGIMLQIENVLYKKGQIELLRDRSEEIKLEYIKNLNLFEQALGRTIKELFFMSDFQNDKSYIVFIL